MSSAPNPSDFSKRLAEAMARAKQGTAAAAQAAPASVSVTVQSDDFSARLSAAIAQSRGEPAPGATATETPPEPGEVPEDGGPVGSGEHVVRAGESISSIAFDTGHFGETIWDAPENADLKAARESPEILLEGDQVHIPELRRKDESGATEQRHRFRRKGTPEKLKIQFQAYDQPRANVPYTLEIEGKFRSGETDAEGWLEEWVPNNARWAKVVFSESESYRLHVGALAPISETAGVVDRLINLGFLEDVTTHEKTIAQAITDFQTDAGLAVTGLADEATRTKLVEEHGS